MASQGDAATEPESEQITDSDTGAKESDFNDTLDSKYVSRLCMYQFLEVKKHTLDH